jgi:SHS2 domain-containing protein
MEVEGASLNELFINAAEGLSSLISEPLDIAPESQVDLALEADTVEDLLVDWLRELLFLYDARGLVLVRSEKLDMTPNLLKARLYFRTRELGEIPPFEIKAVTYHGLSVEKTGEGYVTRIVFDI